MPKDLAIPEPDDPKDFIDGQWYIRKGKKPSYYCYDKDVADFNARLHRHYEKCYIYACYLYYHTGLESPLPDPEFDRIQVALEHSREDWTSWFREKVGDVKPKQMKSNAFAIVLTEDEKAAAIKWAETYDPEASDF